ncbi:hypothetical protein [Ruminococcus sp.]|uniref:hypothetical protein n=1 Tax=Ruminococcus sp. TaxID=41978 RepID=UPI00261C16C0|nr:hypothetical protein [Ruminococcus sp.]MDD6988233.1 hypothetical protein [Ruminococcus sp.]MDY6201709.1 hypothetical protein [Ruminococcus sp.]
MTVWGIGAYNKEKKVSRLQEFLDNNCACIGWTEEQAPILYEVLKAVKKDDYIYIKSYYFPKKRLTIKAVGKVKDSKITKKNSQLESSKGIEVEWFTDFQMEYVKLEKEEARYNVYQNTIYQEYNPRIIDIVKNAIEK